MVLWELNMRCGLVQAPVGHTGGDDHRPVELLIGGPGRLGQGELNPPNAAACRTGSAADRSAQDISTLPPFWMEFFLTPVDLPATRIWIFWRSSRIA
jgi:hypothetical protein